MKTKFLNNRRSPCYSLFFLIIPLLVIFINPTKIEALSFNINSITASYISVIQMGHGHHLLFGSINLPVPSDWWVNMLAAGLGVIIAYIIYYVRLRAIAHQRKILEVEVFERTAELKQLNKELDYEIQRRAEFNRALVHELKTPLTAILASTELFLDELADDPRLGLAKNIYQAARNLDHRTDELLDVTRGEIGLLTIHPQSIDICPLLHSTLETLRPTAYRKNISLTLEIKGTIPKIFADEERLGQVLYNYLANAIKYTPEGGNIILKTFQNNDMLSIEVIDDGPGISCDAQKRLFEPYYQVPCSGGERLGGMGLGLSLSKMIINLHNGEVWVDSRLGQGSKFGFSLPVISKEANK